MKCYGDGYENSLQDFIMEYGQPKEQKLYCDLENDFTNHSITHEQFNAATNVLAECIYDRAHKNGVSIDGSGVFVYIVKE